jgi:MFS family permease
MTQRHGDQHRHNIFSGTIDAYACVQMPIAGRRRAVPASHAGPDERWLRHLSQVAHPLWAILVHDLVIGLAGFTVALFFFGVAIAPLWIAAMDIAPNFAGSSSALMNAAGAVAGILSPVAFGWILDRTGSWTTPFVFSVGLRLFAIIMTYWIRPDRPIEAIPRIGGLAVAGE